METDWRKMITDPIEIKIFDALDDPKWDWRTTTALSTASGAQEGEVHKVLLKYPSYVRKSSVPSKHGDDLYTLQSRYFERKNIAQKIWTIVSSSSS